MARKPTKLPDYFTPEEARALIAAATSYQVRMAMRVMLRTGLRVGECLSLRAADLRFNQDPPIISLRPEVTGNKAKRGREVLIPPDLVESLGGPGLDPCEGQEPGPLRHQPAVGQQVDEGSGRRGGPGPGPGASPCPEAHLREDLRSERRADARPAELAGPPVPGGDGALRGAGGGPPWP